MTEELWDPANDNDNGNGSDKRTQILEAFAGFCHLDDLQRVRQFGRDVRTARYSLELDDQRLLHVGTIDTFISRTKLENLLVVACGAYIDPMKPAEFRNMVLAVIRHATDVEEPAGEKLSDRLADWLDQYTRGATGDSQGAAPTRSPFREGDEIYVHADNLARWLRREHLEQVTVADLRAGLKDLGFSYARVTYNAAGSGATRKRTSTSYYHGKLPNADAEDQAS